MYQNLATAQINIETEEMVSPLVKAEVVKRTLDGNIWLDSNKDGVISSGEEYLSGVKVRLLNENGTKARDINGNEIAEVITGNSGYYKFEDMVKGKYKVQIEYDTEDGIREVTEKQVGSNVEINNKFNSNGETDIITGLDSIASPELKVEHVNAGITYKDTKVIVHHYIEGTTNKVPLAAGGVASDETIEGKVKDIYTTNKAEVPEYYELVATPANANGTMTKDEITVIYYYKLKKYPYTVKYIDKDKNEEIKTAKDGESKDYGTEITVESEKVEIEKYTYDSSDVAGDTSKTKLTIGTETDKNVINLYYTKKTGKVTVKYIDKNTGREIPGPNGASLKEETTEKVDESYTTTKKEIEGYTFVEDTGNTTGTYTENDIEVIYYYKKNTKVTVKYIDKATGEEIRETDGSSSRETKEGLEGDSYRVTSKNFENYALVEEELPTNSEGTMTANEITVIYYYKHISGGVIEKHIDDITGEVLYNEHHEGKEGDEYSISSKTFEGYELIQEKNPTNSTGTMAVDTIEVVYYYRYPTKVTVKYVDKVTGRELLEADGTTSSTEKTGYYGEEYTTEEKTFEGYDLSENPDNSQGNMTKDPIEVIYYYAHKSGGVKVNHYDEITGEKLKEEEKIEGHQGDNYETEPEEIEGYDVVEDRLPENAKGIMTIEETEVNYYYKHKSNVIIKYINKATGEILEQEQLEGHEGDEYKAEAKNISGYYMVEEELPENSEGTMTKDPIEVIYYYAKSAKVIVKYVEDGTNIELTEETLIEGHEKEEYETKPKEIKYYKLIEEKYPENSKGQMEIKEQGEEGEIEDTTYVTYYYKKQTFNLKLDKTIKEVTINGKTQEQNKKVSKLEINKKEINSSSIEVTYLIKVTNDGEIEGTAEIQENIPSGMNFDATKNTNWTIQGNKAILKTDNVNSGETREYTVVLDWVAGTENFGTLTNTAELVKTTNQVNFEETNKEDNKSNADVIISISTGAKQYIIAIGITITVLIGVAIVIAKRK